MTTVYKASRGPLLSDVLVSEVLPDLSRRQRTLLAGSGSARTVRPGEIMGRTLFGTPTVVSDGGNTGAATVASIALKDQAQKGDYVLECIAASNGAATFAVFDPAGNRLADATENVAYVNEQIGFTIGTDSTVSEFAVGDFHTITVPEGSLKDVPLSLTAVDGTARVSGVSAVNASAPDGADESYVCIEKLATFKSTGLIYPAGATSDQKAAINAALEALDLRILNAA